MKVIVGIHLCTHTRLELLVIVERSDVIYTANEFYVQKIKLPISQMNYTIEIHNYNRGTTTCTTVGEPITHEVLEVLSVSSSLVQFPGNHPHAWLCRFFPSNHPAQ